MSHLPFRKGKRPLTPLACHEPFTPSISEVDATPLVRRTPELDGYPVIGLDPFEGVLFEVEASPIELPETTVESPAQNTALMHVVESSERPTQYDVYDHTATTAVERDDSYNGPISPISSSCGYTSCRQWAEPILDIVHCVNIVSPIIEPSDTESNNVVALPCENSITSGLPGNPSTQSQPQAVGSQTESEYSLPVAQNASIRDQSLVKSNCYRCTLIGDFTVYLRASSRYLSRETLQPCYADAEGLLHQGLKVVEIVLAGQCDQLTPNDVKSFLTLSICAAVVLDGPRFQLYAGALIQEMDTLMIASGCSPLCRNSLADLINMHVTELYKTHSDDVNDQHIVFRIQDVEAELRSELPFLADMPTSLRVASLVQIGMLTPPRLRPLLFLVTASWGQDTTFDFTSSLAFELCCRLLLHLDRPSVRCQALLACRTPRDSSRLYNDHFVCHPVASLQQAILWPLVMGNDFEHFIRVVGGTSHLVERLKIVNLADLERQTIHVTGQRANLGSPVDQHRRFCTALFALSDALSPTGAGLLHQRVYNGIQALCQTLDIMPMTTPILDDSTQSSVYNPVHYSVSVPSFELDSMKSRALKRRYTHPSTAWLYPEMLTVHRHRSTDESNTSQTSSEFTATDSSQDTFNPFRTWAADTSTSISAHASFAATPTTPVSSPEGPISRRTCPRGCGRVFTGAEGNWKGHRNRHIKTVHGGYKYTCDIRKCGKVYRRPDALLVHQRDKHPELGRSIARKRPAVLLTL